MGSLEKQLSAAVAPLLSVAARLADSRVPRQVRNFMTRQWDSALWQHRLAALGSGSRIYPHVVIHSPDRVSIGDDVEIAEFVHMWGGGRIRVGDHVRIAAHTVVTSQTHDPTAACHGENFGDTRVVAPVVIEDRAWIGTNAVILPGVTVGEGAIVGAGSVVTKDVPAGKTVVGIPARPLGH